MKQIAAFRLTHFTHTVDRVNGAVAVRGRPEATSAAAIEEASFVLFAKRGFAATTLDDIAAAVGVTRRTLFRYYQSKNDIPWGQFDATLADFRAILDEQPTDLPLARAVHRAVLRFNDFPPHVLPSHRQRMHLILTTPELQAHSALRYAEWRRVIAEYVAARLGLDATDLMPRTVGHVALALAISSYEVWLHADGVALAVLLDEAMAALTTYVRSDRPIGA